MLTWIWVILKNKRLALKRKVWTAANFSSLATCLGFQPNRSDLAPSALWLQMYFEYTRKILTSQQPQECGLLESGLEKPYACAVEICRRHCIFENRNREGDGNDCEEVMYDTRPNGKPKYIQSRSDDSTLRLQGYPHLETVNQFEYV